MADAQEPAYKWLTTNEKISRSKTGLRRSVEHDAACRAGNVGRPLTAAELRQRRQAKLGKPKSPETIEKISRTFRQKKLAWFSSALEAVRLAKAKAEALP